MTDHTHRMEYAGLVNTRGVWRCVDPDCEFSYSRQLTVEEQEEGELPAEEPEPLSMNQWAQV